MKRLEQSSIDLLGRMVFLSLFFLIVFSFSNKNQTVEDTSKQVITTEFCIHNPNTAISADEILTPQIHYSCISTNNKTIYLLNSFKMKINFDNQQFEHFYKCQYSHLELIKPLISCQFLTQKLSFVSDEIPILG